MTLTNSGREPPLPPKGINVNSSNLHGLAVGPQYPSVFEPFLAPRKNLSDADGDGHKSLTTLTRQEARHV